MWVSNPGRTAREAIVIPLRQSSAYRVATSLIEVNYGVNLLNKGLKVKCLML